MCIINRVYVLLIGYVCDLVDDLWILLNGSMSCDVDVIKRDPFDPADRIMYKVRGT